MSDDGKKQKLGRGLSALLGEDRPALGKSDKTRNTQFLPVASLRASRLQPRDHFDEAKLRELADSIREKGVLQPIMVRPVKDGSGDYEIIAGERRWRAAQLARLHEVPVVVRDISDAESLELALIENVQRSDLNPLEEARGYARLVDQFSHSQDAIGRLVGKSRSHIANMLRLLSLPMSIQAMLEDGRLTAGHGRSLITASDPEALANQIVSGSLSVREAESLAKGRKAQAASHTKPEKDPDTLALERRISENLGLKVRIDHRDGTGGTVAITYATLEQLDELCQRLGATGTPQMSLEHR